MTPQHHKNEHNPEILATQNTARRQKKKKYKTQKIKMMSCTDPTKNQGPAVLLVTHIVESGKTRCPLCYLLLILSTPVKPDAHCVTCYSYCRVR